MKTNYKLPKDLNESLKNMEDAIIPSLLDSNKRFTIEFNFEGLKFNRIGITTVSYTHLTLPTIRWV